MFYYLNGIQRGRILAHTNLPSHAIASNKNGTPDGVPPFDAKLLSS